MSSLLVFLSRKSISWKCTEMCTKLKVSLYQLSVVSDLQLNLSKAVFMIKEAAERGSKLIVLPEYFNCPYGSKHFKESAEILAEGNATYDAISCAARENKVWVIAGSVLEKDWDGKIYNTSMTFSPDGSLRGKHRKVHLFCLNTEKLKIDESAFMSPGNAANTIFMDDLGLKFGVGICFDIRYPLLAHKFTREGTSFLVYPAAFNTVTGPLHWELSARARAVDNQQFVLMCSPARDVSADYITYGHSLAVDPFGKIIAELSEEEGVLEVDLDLNMVSRAREEIPILKGLRHDLYSLKWCDQFF